MEITTLESSDYWKVVYNGLLIFMVTRDNHKLVFRQDYRTNDQKKIYTYTHMQ